MGRNLFLLFLDFYLFSWCLCLDIRFWEKIIRYKKNSVKIQIGKTVSSIYHEPLHEDILFLKFFSNNVQPYKIILRPAPEKYRGEIMYSKNIANFEAFHHYFYSVSKRLDLENALFCVKRRQKAPQFFSP